MKIRTAEMTSARVCGLLLLAFLLTAAGPASAAATELKQPTGIDTTLFNPAAHRGEVVYLDFWASWCGPCKKSFPWMKELHQKFQAKGLKIIAVDLDRDPKAAAQFLKTNAPPFEIVYDTRGSLARAFEVTAMPTAFLFDRTGRLRSSHLGFKATETAEVEREIAALLAEAPAQSGGR